MVICMKSKIIENKKIKENNLLQAAFNLFTKEDITNVSVNDIVKSAGVAKELSIFISKINTKFAIF